jgi:kynurenine formamidase
VQDIANWEKVNGHIPLGSIVMAHTGWESQGNVKRGAMRFPGYSEDAAKFLIDGRKILGLGIDTGSVDGGSSSHSVHQYALAHSIYPLQNVANLDRVPSSGAVVVVAPDKITDAASGPVRIFALLK